MTTVGRLFPLLVILSSALTVFILITINSDEGSLSSTATNHPVIRSEHESGPSSENIISFENILSKKRKFNSSNNDLFVLLHIQKTGGTAFERHLVQDLGPNLECSCTSEKRRCSCPRENGLRPPKMIADATWLVSRFSTGWICGLHPDFTQLEKCLTGLSGLYFLTFLRHPLHRFISEFRHVQRGATWKASKGHCRQHDTQLCYGSRSNWSHVDLDEFMKCPNNMAINRQTRMLASYNNHTTCANSQANSDHLLATAISNLNRIAFFGLCEHQRKSQILFEKTFNLEFTKDFSQTDDNKTQSFISKLPGDVVNKILDLNSLDMKLYNHALLLFGNRLERLTI